MNAEDIDKLEAGRELDALIAEKVMGWKWFLDAANLGSGPQYRYLDEPKQWWNPPRLEWDGVSKIAIAHRPTEYQPPEYSSDIAAAWEVVEKLREMGFPVHIQCGQYHYGVVGYRDVLKDEWVWAKSAPLAICRAALKALSAQQKPQNQQLTELFHNSLTNRGKQILAQQAIDDLEAQQSLEESECMVGGHPPGCQCHMRY